MKPDKEQVLHALMRQVLDGQQDRYRELLEGVADLARAYLRRKLNRADEVEDLVQDVLMAVHMKRHTYDPSQPVTAWLHAIARYKLIDHWRRQGRKPQGLDDEDVVDQVEGPSNIAAYETQRDVSVVLSQLPEKQRQIVQMVKLEGLSVQEVAQHMGMTESAVKVTTHRAIKAMAKWLGVKS
jgi:RNA polymerase sigma-70 factor (ECF subfamily)